MSAVLVINDDPVTLCSIRELLECEPYEVRTASSRVDAFRELRRSPMPHAVLLDLGLLETDANALLGQILRLSPSAKVILLANHNDSSRVLQAIKDGAIGFLNHPLDGRELVSLLRRHTPAPEASEAVPVLLEELDSESFFLAASEQMKTVFRQVKRIAQVDVPVLITGESGTGKEIVAKLIHKSSPRANQAFLKVNCAAIPDELLESELFGYEAGAFTGANSRKPGYFEQCNHGTILLDEIGEMPPRLQAKLLQVLQEQKFFRLGGKWPVEMDIRILAATNINVKAATEQGRFRLDLYYRLNAFNIELPPLRERSADIVPLFGEFMTRLAAAYRLPPKPLTETILESWLEHTWPGNLRELHNEAKRYLVLGDEALLAVSTGGGDERVTDPRAASASPNGSLKKMVRDLKEKAEAEAIRRALEQTRWRRKDAAELLGICYKALVYKSRRYGILSPAVRKKKLPKAAGAEEIVKFDWAVKSAANAAGLSALKAVEMKDGGDRR